MARKAWLTFGSLILGFRFHEPRSSRWLAATRSRWASWPTLTACYFLDHRADGTHFGFTAANLGYALLDDTVPAALNPQQEAKAIAHLVADEESRSDLNEPPAPVLAFLVADIVY